MISSIVKFSPNETVMEVTNRHWIDLAGLFLKAFIIAPIAGLMGTVVYNAFDDVWQIQLIVLMVSLLSVGYVIYRVMLWKVHQVIVTNQRVLEVSGIFYRKVNDMDLLHISDSAFNQTILGRILGYAAIRLESFGQNQALEYLTYIPRAGDIYQTILTQRSYRQNAHQNFGSPMDNTTVYD